MLDEANICNLTANSDYYYRLKKPNSEVLHDRTIALNLDPNQLLKDTISVNSEYLTPNRIITLAVVLPLVVFLAIIIGIILLRFRTRIKAYFSDNCFKTKHSILYKKSHKQLKKQAMSRNKPVSLNIDDHTIADGDSHYEDTTYSKIAIDSLPKDYDSVLFLPTDAVASPIQKQNRGTFTDIQDNYQEAQLLNNYCQTSHSMCDNNIPDILVPSLKPSTGKDNFNTRTSTISNFEPFFNPQVSELGNQDFRKLLNTIPQLNSVFDVSGGKDCVIKDRVKSVNRLNDEINEIATKIKNIEKKIFNSTKEIRDVDVQIDFDDRSNDIPLKRFREQFKYPAKIRPFLLSTGDRGKYISKLNEKKHSESLSSTFTKPYNERTNSAKVNRIPSNTNKQNLNNQTLMNTLNLVISDKAKEENQWDKDNKFLKSKTSRSNINFTRNHNVAIHSKKVVPITYVTLKSVASIDSMADVSSYATETNPFKKQKSDDCCNFFIEYEFLNICRTTVERFCKIQIKNLTKESLGNINHYWTASHRKSSNLFDNKNDNSPKLVKKRPYSFENEIEVSQIKRNISDMSVDNYLLNTESILIDERANTITENPQKIFKSSIVINDGRTDSHFTSIDYSFGETNYSLNIVPESSDTETMKNDFFRDFHIPNCSKHYQCQSSKGNFGGDFCNDKLKCNHFCQGTCQRNGERKKMNFCRNNRFKRSICKFMISRSKCQDDCTSQKMNNADSNLGLHLGAGIKL